MFKLIKKKRRDMHLRKIKEGDGHPLKPYRLWHNLTRSLFHLQIEDNTQEVIDYSVEYRYFVSEPQAELYRNGRHTAYSKLPATFPVSGGVIEVASGSYGIKRMHYVKENGDSQMLQPDHRSIRGLRVGIEEDFPVFSKLIGIISIILLIIVFILGLPQIIEQISQIPWVAENIGVFNSPFNFSIWENLIIAGIGALAGMERTLIFRNQRLLHML
ncbi:hypothetical protein [Corticicoccus populi]|uniref:Uncharacterized protein n=1 Tax=Corticicoccus populi TaxID=1812821 RepID=A0ABW5WUE5_9STAP